MSPLTSEQKQLLFDYCIGLTSSNENAQVEALIASNEQAAAIHSQLQSALSPLESLEPETCPDYLAERTVWRLKSAASSSRQRLEQLLASEETRAVGPRPRAWASMGKRLAMAALFMIVGSTLIATFNAVTGYARQSSQRQRCQIQQSSILQGLTNYILDNDGERPAVATAAGDPWWQVGKQGNENHSNTRRIFVLVKEGYANPSDFLCSGNMHGELPELTPGQIETLKDFPDRRYVSYSFQIHCGRTEGDKLLCRKVMMSDRNPLFEALPDDFSKPLGLRLNKRLLTINSMNHNRRGQNVAFGDGRVEYLRTRLIGTDDIFTLQDTDIYQGCEVPSRETDFFVVP